MSRKKPQADTEELRQTMSTFQTNFVVASDKPKWRTLFEGYAEFYGVPMSDAIADEVWSWLLDPSHVLEGLLTRTDVGLAVGMAHVRACPRPLGGNEIGFLDDMYVTMDARGSGAADAIFESLQSLARERGWCAIRWITQHFNERGRAFYDRYTSGPSDFIMYQWKE
ncbi:GNAT family N-acetyltransferase [Marinobacter sp.]|uniref:GNAT family N-acetyltransferase n=1 Tax=Marinobacter sp. TaxID=50741 RepID=UPI003F9B8C4B